MQNKSFDDWNTKKQKLNNQTEFNHPKVGEIWWCSIGYNIGKEVYGKDKDFTRPVLVINIDSSESFIGLPLSSKIKKSKYRVCIKTSDLKLHDVLVYQVRLLDKRRLGKRLYILDKEEYKKIKLIFNSLYKNIIAP